jgi:hypothetical protein
MFADMYEVGAARRSGICEKQQRDSAVTFELCLSGRQILMIYDQAGNKERRAIRRPPVISIGRKISVPVILCAPNAHPS